ncbi:uncharacterized protein ANIA_11366 [Aspergillus nidulans FGSC A4]|uniref:Uncharacterized protein n=1 Tax=Emericella nidulans (strain FGSC A4 / ATCC 38163 / CBS 112.46 / NRRL 194 / M139) TaxID=227321 RepID=C8VJL2_EMENI|nr:hypothetical protein [Aspergillus nidulans FGSC A4]CBF84015.1 TPA: hypothetical protein ANIA_11366 [Aspergillus nidulans FGSC A4]
MDARLAPAKVHRDKKLPPAAGGSLLSLLILDPQGWSSGINGKLANAPRYQELDGFDKEKSGLFPIHVQIDKLGFI